MKSRMPKLLRAAAFFIALTLPALAWAQGSILQGGLAPPGHVPMYSGPSSAATIVGDSGSANGTCSGGPVNCGLSEFLQEDRFPGLGPFGTNSCFYDLGETHYLCFDANAAGRGLIVFGAVGNASPIPLTCIINGVTQNCLGTANLVPPVTLTDNQTGPITTIGATLTALTEPGISADLIESYEFCTTPHTATACGGGNYDALAGVGISNSGTTTNLVTGVAGYALANQPFVGSGPFSIALFGTGVVNVDGGRIEGLNVNVGDRQYRVAQASGTHNRIVNGAELDISVSYPDTTATGLLIAGNSVVQPNNSTAVAVVGQDFSAATPGSIAKWTQAFYTFPGVATHFANVGPLTSSIVNTDSQDFIFGAYVASAAFNGQFYFGTAHSPNFGSTVAPSFNMNYPLQIMTGGLSARAGTDQVLQLAGHLDLSSGTLISSRNDANNLLQPLEVLSSDLSLRATNAVTIIANGGLVIPVGTPASSSATCGTGEITFDSAFVYTCVATNTWRRVATVSF